MRKTTCRRRTASGRWRACRSSRHDPLRFEPGTQFRYSTYGWVLVSAAVEAAANEPFSAFMRSQIFEPLGMGDTTPDSPKEPIPDRATFYFPRFNEDTHYGPEVATEVDYSCFAGAGAFLSTPSDLVQFGIAVSNGKLLKPDTVAMLQTPQRLTSGEENSYGLGWDLETVPLAGEQREWRATAGPCWRRLSCWVARRRSWCFPNAGSWCP